MYLNNTCLSWSSLKRKRRTNHRKFFFKKHNGTECVPGIYYGAISSYRCNVFVLTFIFTKQFMIFSLIQSAEPDGHMMIMTNPRFCLFVFCKETVLWTFIPSFKMVPYFFQRYSWTDVKTSLFSAERYRTMLLNILILDIQERGCLPSTVFMQNGELLHIRLRMPEVFWQHFTHNCIISRELPSK